jgi:replicative DNA helicase
MVDTKKLDALIKRYGIKSKPEVMLESLKYIKDRMDGRNKSVKTPWTGLNKAGIGGLEWGSMLTIGARPGAGKTMFVSQILREVKDHNPDQKFNILEFQFEMGTKQAGSRDLAGQLGMDYGVIVSAEKPLDAHTYARLEKLVDDCIKQYNLDVKKLGAQGCQRVMVSASSTVEEIKDIILSFYEAWGSNPMIVTIDHSWLIKKDKTDKDKFDVLYNVTEMLMQLKNQIPIIVLMLTQLNRSIEEANRKTAGSIANYPTSSDIFGGDALMQGSDMVIVLSRPSKLDIKSYGPYAYQTSDDLVFVHLIKIRNGDDKLNMLFFKMEGKRQRFIGTIEPTADRPDGTAFIPYSMRKGRKSEAPTAEIGTEI